MIEKIEEILKEMNNSKVFAIIVKAYRKMYLGLIDEGFSEEEAMGMVTSQGLNVSVK